ncbi:MAG: PAS domain S-box protein [Syntrophobacterales bacterium]|jgi:PAS domain S-box-containing protein|nr:PAS domain S-box protein [Syntrophobacterales bacterium]
MNHEDFAAIFDRLAAGIMITDTTGAVTSANNAACYLLGRREETLRGMRVEQLFGDINIRDKEKQRVNKQGREWEIVPAAVSAPDGHSKGFVWLIYDITETLQLEKTARHKEKNAAMLEMAAQLAHEVRNPLGSIELFSSLLMRNIQEEKQRLWIEQIRTAVKNIDQKIEELLQYVKTVEPLMDIINIHEVLREILLYSDRISDQGYIFLSVDYGPLDPIIRGNAVMIRRIFTGLLLNALQSLTKEGHIRIATAIEKTGKGEPAVKIRFSDDRPGNPREHIQRFFNPGEDDDRVTQLNFAVFQDIIAIHKGALSAESAPDGTISFSIVFPLIGSSTINPFTIEGDMSK